MAAISKIKENCERNFNPVFCTKRECFNFPFFTSSVQFLNFDTFLQSRLFSLKLVQDFRSLRLTSKTEMQQFNKLDILVHSLINISSVCDEYSQFEGSDQMPEALSAFEPISIKEKFFEPTF